MVWRPNGPDGNESAKVRWDIVPFTRGCGLDLGCGPWKAFPHFIGVDNGSHERFGYQIKPDLLLPDCAKLDIIADAALDFIFSSHLLEHIEDFKAALREWWRTIKVGGHLVLYLPHKALYPNIGQEHANPDHKHDFLPVDIVEAMGNIKGGWDLRVNEERNNGDEYSFLQVYRKVEGTRRLESWKKTRPLKTAGVVRYGAFGDLMQASSVFKGLKDEGYHVTVYSSPPGCEVITHDPHIDELILQDKDQVPNGDLPAYWRALESKFDRFVNLSESVEGSFLALPGRTLHSWPPEVRHKVMNRNYLEVQHELARVPHKPQIRFYATDQERTWAREYRKRCGSFCILWALAGSSPHKTWPYLDPVIAWLMIAHPAIHIVMVGNESCKLLEAGWDNEPRVHRTSGVWSIRQTLAFAEYADLVIGPETGVLNAVSGLKLPKVVFLSHSTNENLTRDWLNTTVLRAESLTCRGRGENYAPACHQLHYTWEHCTRTNADAAEKTKKIEDATQDERLHAMAVGSSACMAAIKPDEVCRALHPHLEIHFTKAA